MEEQPAYAFSDSEMGASPTANAATRTESSVSQNGRQKLEEEILSIAGSKDVQIALRQRLFEISKHKSNERRGTIQQAASRGGEALKTAFVEGVRRLLEVSCDRRLEVTHWMVKRLCEEATSIDLVECFFVEAANQVLEAEEGESKEIEQVFGSC